MDNNDLKTIPLSDSSKLAFFGWARGYVNNLYPKGSPNRDVVIKALFDCYAEIVEPLLDNQVELDEEQ